VSSIKEVAKNAGVGIATVSRVVNNSGYVKKETREKIERVIKEINYVPNEIARSMIKQKNGIVAFVIPNSSHLFFGELLNYVELELYEHGYKLMVCNSSQKIEKELTYLEMLENNRVDACVFLTNNDIEGFLPKERPLISFDRKFNGVPFVSSDNYNGGEIAAEHLIEIGCTKLMFIGDDAQGEDTKITTEVSKRRLGFIDYARLAGLDQIVNIEYPFGDYLLLPQEARNAIRSHTEVDGIFCISDAIACEVILELEKNGRKVPEDVKVIGYDGGRSFLNLGKKVTSIDQNPKEIAKAICELVIGYYSNTKIANKILPVKLNLGETT
jgi:LacI family transcriptional regulator